jgi:hypothetical protein
MPIDSKKHKLNAAGCIGIFLKENPQPHPPQVMLPAILTELSHPGVHTKQFGNTLFEVMPGQNGQAFFKAFNADTGGNFVENSKLFCVWARRVLHLKVLVTEFTDPAIERLFKAISMNPPMHGMGYSVYKTTNGGTRIVLNLGG